MFDGELILRVTHAAYDIDVRRVPDRRSDAWLYFCDFEGLFGRQHPRKLLSDGTIESAPPRELKRYRKLESALLQITGNSNTTSWIWTFPIYVHLEYEDTVWCLYRRTLTDIWEQNPAGRMPDKRKIRFWSDECGVTSSLPKSPFPRKGFFGQK